MRKVVIDTNIFISALMNRNGAPRHILRLALRGEIKPVFGNALFGEYEDVLGRDHVMTRCILNETERRELFEALLSVSEWTKVYYLWRPNLRDAQDNHLIELALAAGVDVVITANKKDFRQAELSFPELRFLTAGEFLDEHELRRH